MDYYFIPLASQRNKKDTLRANTTENSRTGKTLSRPILLDCTLLWYIIGTRTNMEALSISASTIGYITYSYPRGLANFISDTMKLAKPLIE